MVEMIMVINLPKITKRKYIHARLSKASVSKVIIERTLKLVTVTITTARPGHYRKRWTRGRQVKRRT
jgi:ribosomal protein S3